MAHSLAFFMLCLFIGVAEQPNASKVEITITNLKPVTGTLSLSVFKSKEGFPRDAEKAIKRIDLKVTMAIMRTEITLPPGTYAISVAHDVNDNKKIDTNFLGIPKEPLGMSNYPKIGQPKFDKAKFELKDGETLRLTIPMDTIF